MNIKKTFTKIGVGLGLSVTLTVSAQNAGTHIWQFKSLLNGYNLMASNTLIGPANLNPLVTGGVQASNLLYTRFNGQIVYSYSNNVNGGLGTNQVAPDAFKAVQLVSDANGDFIGTNATLFIMLGNTNYIPTVGTNSQGQYITVGSSTNGLIAWNGGNITPWPLWPSTGPNWLPAATTNQYPTIGAITANGAFTNQVFVSLYAAPSATLGGDLGDSLMPTIPFFDSTADFTYTFTVTGSGTTPQVVSVGLPTSLIQKGRLIECTIAFTNTTYLVGTNIDNLLINQIGIVQPQ